MDSKEMLKQFLAKAAKIQRYQLIYKEDGYSIAGDGFWLVRVKEEVEDATDSGDLNLLRYFNYYNSQKKDFLVTSEMLKKAVKINYSLTPECTQCRGTGKLKNEKTEKIEDCEYCNATGMDSYGAIKISDHSNANFARLYKLASLLDGVYLSTSQKSLKEPIFFQKDQFEGFFMPVMIDKEDKENLIDLRTIK